MTQVTDRIEGQTVIVTGASRGIGLSVARALAQKGARLALLDIAAEAQEDVAAGIRETGGDAQAFHVDLSHAETIPDAVAAVRAQMGPIAGLVNNAGILQLKELSALTTHDFDLTMAINLRAPFLLMQAVAPDMIEAGWGRIVSIASSAAKTGGSNAQGVYGVSKAALICLTKSWARELAPRGITVNSVSPALIETDMIKGLESYAAHVPLGRLGRPEEVAGTICFLMSDVAAFITGEDIDVNGGFLMD